MTAATHVILVLAAAGFVYRLLRGPTLTDRVNAVGGLLVAGMGAIATNAAHTGTGSFVPVLVAIALVGPISNGMIARFIEINSEDRPADEEDDP
jgi:multicomponent Na+:H+ antiporter subunit F